MAKRTVNKGSKVNKPTKSAGDREAGISDYQAQNRRAAGVEIRPAGKGSGNKQY